MTPGWGSVWFVSFAQQLAGGAEQAPLPSGTTGFGVQLFRSALALVGVCVTAWLVLRWMAQRGYGAAGGARNLRVIERVALDARKSICLVEAGSRVFLVGASEQSLTTLAELSRDDLKALPARDRDGAGAAQGGRPASFAAVLARIRRSGSASQASPAEPLGEGSATAETKPDATGAERE
ncbi:MAG: flagellar biosynthetic protein FliO [Deltaproteobacteria bacterium]